MQAPTLRTEHGLEVVQPATPRPSRLLFWLSIVLAVALVAMAVWVVVDRYVLAPPTSEEIATLVEENLAAWNAGDEVAILDLYADDARYYDGPLTVEPIVGDDAIASYVDTVGTMGYRIEPVSATTIAGDTAVTVVQFGSGPSPSTVMSTMRFDRNGDVIQQWYDPVANVETTI
jgi:hypothetical protein